MKLKVTQSVVPAGTYRVKLLPVMEVVDDNYGQGLKFVFVMVDGPHAGRS